MAELFNTQRGGVLDFFNTFSGGSLERMSIIALGVMPYITASIVVQLGAAMYEPLKALKKEGEAGARSSTNITRYLTVLLTTVQGYFIAGRPRGPGATRASRRWSSPASPSALPPRSASSAAPCS
jgi:preprotein translocase subunit SecY